MSYTAFISPVKTRPHPNADNLQLGLIKGNQVVIGKNIIDGQLMVYFPSDGQLSKEFCDEHDLIARFDPVTRKNINGGYFSDNRRVKTQKFRGEKSDGFAMPLDCLEFTGVDISTLVDGFEFDTINGIQICQKYYTPATRAQANNIPAKKKNVMFAEHVDTEQLDRNLDLIPEPSHIIITGKAHGCVDATTLIDTLEFGVVPIKYIFDNKIKCRVKSLDIKNNQICYNPIADWYFYPNDTDWYVLGLDDGTELIITGNNPVWLPLFNCYRKVENLQIGDVLTKD